MYKLFLFGSPRIQKDQQWIPYKTQKTLALLCYLAITQQPQQRDNLMALLWPDSSRKQAQASLRRAVHNLRQIVGDAVVQSDRQMVWVTDALWVDVVAFQQFAEQTDDVDVSRRAIELYTGTFLEGFGLPDSVAFDEWQLYETGKLRQQFVTVLTVAVQRAETKQAWADAIELAQKYVALDTLDEHAHVQLMALYARAGRKTAVQQQYETLTAILQTELELEPSPETTQQYQHYLALAEKASGGILSPNQDPAQMEIRLPSFATSFVGREGELSDLREILRHPDKQLITLVGLGGVGKTRLAVQSVMLSLAEMDELLVGYCDLVPITQSPLSTMAQQVTLKPKPKPDLHAQLVAHLQGQPCWLILDNFEHLLAFRDEIAHLLNELPLLKFIVTCREPLGLPMEWVYPVGGLLYDAEPIEQEEVASAHPTLTAPMTLRPASQLFVARARQAQPHLDLSQAKYAIRRICQLVEGMPLGIELAAAWSRVLSCEQIATEIERNLDVLADPKQGRPARHQSIRVVFESSWSRLSLAEQAMLAQMSLFRGSFSHEALMVVTQGRLVTLYGLVNKALVERQANGRYRLHQLLQQFAQEKYATLPRTSASERFATFYAKFTYQQDQQLSWDNSAEAIANLTQELPNILQAWQWLAKEAHIKPLAQMNQGLYQIYSIRGQYEQGVAQFRHITEILQARPIAQAGDDEILATLWSTQGEFLYVMGQLSHARHCLLQALSFCDKPEQKEARGRCERLIGTIEYRLGRYAHAQQHLMQALHLEEETNDQHDQAVILMTAGAVQQALGNYQQAEEQFQTALTLYTELAYDWGIAHTKRFLGSLARIQKAYDKATIYLTESLALCQQMNHLAGEALVLNELGQLLHETDQLDQAEQQLHQGYQLGKTTGVVMAQAVALQNLSRVKGAQGEPQERDQFLHEALHQAVASESPPLMLDVLTDVVKQLHNGRYQERALALASFVNKHPASTHLSRARIDQMQLQLSAAPPNHQSQTSLSVVIQDVIQTFTS